MKRKKNLSIALVSSYPFTQVPGGVKDFILGLKEALIRHGCEVSVIAPGAKEAYEKGLVDFVLGMGFKVATDQTEFSASLSRKATAKKILEIIKPDIILINEPFVPSIGHTLISTISEIKNPKLRPIVIGQFHASREDLNWRLKTVEFIVRHLIRRPKLDRRTILGLSSGYVTTINSNLDGRIAVSQATKNFWQSKLPANYKVIYNGIDTKKLTPNGNPTSLKLRGARTILFAGRHDSRKGIDDLINAFGILIEEGQDIKLKITGDGEMTKMLQRMARELGLEGLIEFTGTLPRLKLIEAYRTADLVVAPSTGGEGFNRTIIEARSCGTLVVCTDIEGHREAIGKDLSAYMAKPRNPRSLADQIMAVLNLPKSQKEKIKSQGREEVVKNFDWDVIVKQHLEYYRELSE